MNQSIVANSPAQKSWVVFSGQTELSWLRFLRPGFRHCFVLLFDGQCWLSVDPMLNYMDVQVHHVSPEFDLPRWLEGRGHIVIPARNDRSHKKPAPWRPFTCVEAVKRVLGIHARGIVTPWQLYRYLTKKGDLSWEV